MAKAEETAWGAVNRTLKDARKFDSEAGIFLCVDTLAAALSNTPFAVLSGSVQLLRGIQEVESEPLPNPLYVDNGYDPAPSPASEKFLKRQKSNGTKTSLFKLGGTVASLATQVDVAGAAVGGSAVGTSLMHLIKIQAIAKRHKANTIQEWCAVLTKAKSARAAINGASTAASLVPFPLAGAALGLAAGIGAAAVKSTLTHACYMTAIQIHWRAFVEQKLSGSRHIFGKGRATGGGVGPASELYWEIFTRRGFTGTWLGGGQDDIAGMSGEPGGWYPLAEKLLEM